MNASKILRLCFVISVWMLLLNNQLVKGCLFGQVIKETLDGSCQYTYQHYGSNIGFVVSSDFGKYQYKLEHIDKCDDYCKKLYAKTQLFIMDALVFSLVDFDPNSAHRDEGWTLTFSYYNLGPMWDIDPTKLTINITTKDGLEKIPEINIPAQGNQWYSLVKFNDFLRDGIQEFRISLISLTGLIPLNANLDQEYDLDYPRSVNFVGDKNKVQMNILELSGLPTRITLYNEQPNQLLNFACFKNNVYNTMGNYRWESSGSISDVLTTVTLSNMTTDVFGNLVSVNATTLELNLENPNSLYDSLTSTHSKYLGGSSVASTLTLQDGNILRIMAVDKAFRQHCITPNQQVIGSMKFGQVISYRVQIYPQPFSSIGQVNLNISTYTSVLFLQTTHYDADSSQLCSLADHVDFETEVTIKGMDVHQPLSISNAKRNHLIAMNLFFICKAEEGCNFDFTLSGGTSHNPIDETTIIIVSSIAGIALILNIIALLVMVVVVYLTIKRRKVYVSIQ
ncbi:predicted protein [Naegleria gruberi]|uniref:Predicted protein n=1 Tax=Naegleria gruberi TaxID=5762 RepID=D2W1U1_NAEGR|nr:uncharacterized protein NAEGRDRAFT_75378 [Naegleria gruberi]EFC36976.1 predicted protein [Naegleria gruberi]|eukprot:XP_002669720.1 predicted protein [Naegleria gruberi strain NEG-M]